MWQHRRGSRHCRDTMNPSHRWNICCTRNRPSAAYLLPRGAQEPLWLSHSISHAHHHTAELQLSSMLSMFHIFLSLTSFNNLLIKSSIACIVCNVLPPLWHHCLIHVLSPKHVCFVYFFAWFVLSSVVREETGNVTIHLCIQDIDTSSLWSVSTSDLFPLRKLGAPL